MFSLLLHLLLLLALYQQGVPAPVLPAAKAAPLTVQIISWPQNTPKAEPVNPKNTEQPTSLKTTANTKLPEQKTKANPQQNITKTTSTKSKKIVTTTLPAASSAPVAVKPKAEPTINPGIANRILDSVAAKQQQQAGQLSSEEIQALWQKPTESKAINVTRYGPKPAYAADNVLEVQAEGSFIEKVGDYCYQAKAGADIRRDISSMKPVSCGKDANEALYNSIMNKIGQ